MCRICVIRAFHTNQCRYFSQRVESSKLQLHFVFFALFFVTVDLLICIHVCLFSHLTINVTKFKCLS